MAGMTELFVKAYKVANSTGIGQYCCVIQDTTTDGQCKLPTAQNQKGFLGVTLEAQAYQYKGIAVQKGGTVRVVAGGTITRGDRVAINSVAGDVYSVEALIEAAPSGTAVQYHVVGKAEVSAVSGDIFFMTIQDYTVNLAVS